MDFRTLQHVTKEMYKPERTVRRNFCPEKLSSFNFWADFSTHPRMEKRKYNPSPEKLKWRRILSKNSLSSYHMKVITATGSCTGSATLICNDQWVEGGFLDHLVACTQVCYFSVYIPRNEKEVSTVCARTGLRQLSLAFGECVTV